MILWNCHSSQSNVLSSIIFIWFNLLIINQTLSVMQEEENKFNKEKGFKNSVDNNVGELTGYQT